MHKLKEYKDRIIQVLDNLSVSTAHNAKAGRYDVLKDAEEFYRGLLNLFYSWNLTNANTAKDPNFQGVDLLDKDKKIAVQVTAQTGSEKVHDAIRGFKAKALLDGYEVLYVLMFKGKEDFPRADFAKTVANSFTFDGAKHIIDHSNFCAELKDMEFDRVEAIYEYLKKYDLVSPYNNLDESIDDMGIISEIFNYIQKNKPQQKINEDALFNDNNLVDLKEKIKLNFSKNQEESINRMILNTWNKKGVVQEFIEKHAEEYPSDILELQIAIQNLYCQLKGEDSSATKIEDINILKKIADNYVPEKHKKNPSYIANAEALVFYFFEFCFIGNKTLPPTSLFD